MTTQEIANRLVALCSEGNYEQAQRELYATDANSIEPASAEGMQSVAGLEAIIAKGHQFQAMVQQVHGSSIGGPLVAGNQIAITIGLDVTFKDGNRMNMNEIAMYTVKDGKIVQEQFFY